MYTRVGLCVLCWWRLFPPDSTDAHNRDNQNSRFHFSQSPPLGFSSRFFCPKTQKKLWAPEPYLSKCSCSVTSCWQATTTRQEGCGKRFSQHRLPQSNKSPPRSVVSSPLFRCATPRPAFFTPKFPRVTSTAGRAMRIPHNYDVGEAQRLTVRTFKYPYPYISAHPQQLWIPPQNNMRPVPSTTQKSKGPVHTATPRSCIFLYLSFSLSLS